jgi:hypothetical protein
MKRFVLAFVAAGLLIGAVASPALAARTTRIPIKGSDTVLTDNYGAGWQTGNIWHERGDVESLSQTGTLGSGTETTVASYDINVVTGAGSLWGTSVSVIGSGGFDCIWYAKFEPYTPQNLYNGADVCHGYGTYTGWQVWLTFVANPSAGPLGGDTFTGYAFTPGF